jgi:transportin-1
LARNVSLCIGRLANLDPITTSESLDKFIKQFCLSLRMTKNSREKEEAFAGLCKAILNNPNGVVNHFPFFCDAISQYMDAPIELAQIFQNIIFAYKQSLGERWIEYFNNFPERLKSRLQERFLFI